jgi:hypothetical protein
MMENHADCPGMCSDRPGTVERSKREKKRRKMASGRWKEKERRKR